jgi:hypothetical protein
LRLGKVKIRFQILLLFRMGQRVAAYSSGEVDLLDQLSELIVLTASRCLLGREIRETLFAEVGLCIPGRSLVLSRPVHTVQVEFS